MKPKVILYAAVSLDGRTTGFSVDLGLFYSLASRWGEDASLVGCDTFLNAPGGMPVDDESEVPPATPEASDRRPVLVVPDSRGRLKSWHYLRRQPYWKDFVSLCTSGTPPAHLRYLQRKGVKVLTVGADHVDFHLALHELSNRFGITTVRVDSGGTLNGVLLRAGLVDEVHLLVHPTLVGGTEAKIFFRDAAQGPAGEIPLRLLGCEVQRDGLLLLSYAVCNIAP